MQRPCLSWQPLENQSILIPYPYATNGHQETNARSLAQVGGAEMILQEDLGAEGLANAISNYMEHPQKLQRMGEAALGFARHDADRMIVDQLMMFLKGAS